MTWLGAQRPLPHPASPHPRPQAKREWGLACCRTRQLRSREGCLQRAGRSEFLPWPGGPHGVGPPLTPRSRMVLAAGKLGWSEPGGGSFSNCV